MIMVCFAKTSLKFITLKITSAILTYVTYVPYERPYIWVFRSLWIHAKLTKPESCNYKVSVAQWLFFLIIFLFIIF